jgi:hypothetical protein
MANLVEYQSFCSLVVEDVEATRGYETPRKMEECYKLYCTANCFKDKDYWWTIMERLGVFYVILVAVSIMNPFLPKL